MTPNAMDRETRLIDPPARATPYSTPVVPQKRLRCPKCRGIDIKTTRTLQSDEHLVMQRKRCQTCDLAFITIAD